MEMGAVMSSYTSKRRNRKLRRQMVKKIFCVQKVKKEVLSAKISVLSSMELMKQMMRKVALGSALAAAAKSNVKREAIYKAFFVEGVRIPKASSMVIMEEPGK